MTKRIAVIGSGAAGLTCAATLTGAGMDVTVYEAKDRIGGRLATDHVEGFTLDHGFQVLMTGYPSVASLLDLQALDVRHFESGALIFDGEGFQWLIDPIGASRFAFLSTLRSRLPSTTDKVQIARMKLHLSRASVKDLLGGPVESTREVLRYRWGFSDRIIEAFFAPYLGTFMLDKELTTRSPVSLMLLRAIFRGKICLPGAGIQAVAQQLAHGLQDIRLNEPVEHLQPLIDEYDAVVVAAGAPASVALLDGIGTQLPGLSTATNVGATLYFAARKSPLREATIVTNGAPHDYVSTLAVPSKAAPSYSPTGWHLICANVIGEHATKPLDDLVEPVLKELRPIAGDQVDEWRFLRGYRSNCPDARTMGSSTVQVTDTVYACGDHREVGGIEAAMYSGQKAADAIMATTP